MIATLVFLAAAAITPDAGWPPGITVDCGKMQVRFESRSFWTLYRLDWQGVRLGVDNFGSHYGSVAKFPGIGFIGSGHTENAKELVERLELVIDGKVVTGVPASQYRCRDARLVKDSAIRDLRLHTEINLREGRIDEAVTVTALKDTPVDLVYHFMHPWSLEAKEYLVKKTDGQTVGGTFVGDNRFHVNAPLRWAAIYAPDLKAGTVMVFRELPPGVKAYSKFWDVPTRYRKHYLHTSDYTAINAGSSCRFAVTVLPFDAEAGDWKITAERMAEGIFGK